MSKVEDTHRLQRLRKRANELRAWRNAAEAPITDWTFTAGEQTSAIAPGELWPVVETPVRFHGSGTVPADWTGRPLELELWLGGEGFITLSTGFQSGLDPFHHAFPLTGVNAGETLAVDAEVVPKGMFGSHVARPRVERAHFVVPHLGVRALERDLAILLETGEWLDDHDVVPLLLNVAEEALRALRATWPTATPTTVARLVQGYVDPIGEGFFTVPSGYAVEATDVEPFSGAIWHLPDAPEPLAPLPAAAIAAVNEAREIIAAGLARIKRDYPAHGKLALTGHAHIDLAWLWPVAETRRKGRRTFANVLNLMDQYDDFRFNQSSAQLYAWIEQDDPALFARARERIAEGRWDPVGGSWVEPDCQVTGGEAFVRQLFYGQRYFEEKFGKRSGVAWLPDVFGFSGAIPQLLLGAGISRFFTIKLNWNETNVFPHDLFLWEGIDGSRVVANMFRNLSPAHGYNGSIRPRDVIGTWRKFDGKRYTDESLLAFGWGDGGGGPTARMLENYERMRDYPALPSLRMTDLEHFFANLPESGLPRWVGELYLEYHRGTLTTQALVKQLNRQAEHRLLEAELFGAIAGGDYPAARLETAWKTLLLNQFHDILPGSSIAEVYADTHRELNEVVATATEVRDQALSALAGPPPTTGSGESNILVANAALDGRPLTVELPAAPTDAGLMTPDGTAVRVQPVAGGALLHDPRQTVPAVGWMVLTAGPLRPPVPSQPDDVAVQAGPGGIRLENALLSVEIGGDGTIHRLYDRVNAREALADRGNQLWAYVDKPRTYDAWDIEDGYQLDGEEITTVDEIAVVETGPLRAAVRVVRRYRDSTIAQTYRLLAGSRLLEVQTAIDWHERQVLVKAVIPVAVRATEATFETMYGAVRRPTHRNTSWDAARFEVSAHRYVDLSESGYGVALLNDAKYGFSVTDNVMTISLVRGPLYPDPYADEGRHAFAYAILPHVGDLASAGVPAAAFAFNSPLLAVPARAELTGAQSFVSGSGLPVALGSLKPAADGDGLIVRVYEPHGARGATTLRFARPLTAASVTNLLEEPADDADLRLSVNEHSVTLSLRPYQVVTLRVKLVEA